MAICQSCANPSNTSTNSCSCGCNPPTPAASTSCEVCADLSAMDCVYYKGTITNNLNLGTNFRLKTFVEKAIPILGSINADTTDKYITGLTITPQSAKGSFEVTTEYNDSTAGPDASFDVSSHFATANINYATVSSSGGSDIILELSAIGANIDVVNTVDDYLGVMDNPGTSREGVRKVDLQLFFSLSDDSEDTIIVKVSKYNETGGSLGVIFQQLITTSSTSIFKIDGIAFTPFSYGDYIQVSIQSDLAQTIQIESYSYIGIQELY